MPNIWLKFMFVTCKAMMNPALWMAEDNSYQSRNTKLPQSCEVLLKVIGQNVMQLHFERTNLHSSCIWTDALFMKQTDSSCFPSLKVTVYYRQDSLTETHSESKQKKTEAKYQDLFILEDFDLFLCIISRFEGYRISWAVLFEKTGSES